MLTWFYVYLDDQQIDVISMEKLFINARIIWGTSILV